MKLSELFPKNAIITLQGQEYEVKINTRATLQLEHDYPDKVVEGKEVSSQTQLQRVFASALSNMKSIDMVNVLFAGLLHTKAFKTKDELIDAMEIHDHELYTGAIISACVNSTLTPEQLEKLEVMQVTSKAKKNELSETTEQNTPSTVQSAG